MAANEVQSFAKRSYFLLSVQSFAYKSTQFDFVYILWCIIFKLTVTIDNVGYIYMIGICEINEYIYIIYIA